MGVFDKGIDFNHANFRNQESKSSRLKRAILFRKYTVNTGNNKIYDYDGNIVKDYGKITEIYDNATDIDTLTTDSYDESHGTHTSSTAAGCYEGTYTNDKDNVIIGGPYRGIAYKADLILAGANNLKSEFQYIALNSMDSYATEHNQPLVVNLSLGSINNWYDGKNEANRFFDKFTGYGNKPGRIVCVSAGNFGDINYGIYKNVKAGETLKTGISSFYSTDQKKFILPLYLTIYTTNTDVKNAISMDIDIYDKEKNLIKTYTQEDLTKEKLYAGVCAASHDNRCYSCLAASFAYNDSVIAIAKITSPVETNIRVICASPSGETYDLIDGGFDGVTAGNSESSINTLSCTNSVINVGAWTNKNLICQYYESKKLSSRYKSKQGSEEFPIGDICEFSSYITCDDNGYSRPDVAAPGYFVMSGFNNYDLMRYDSKGTPLPLDVNQRYSQSNSGLATTEAGRTDGRRSALGWMSGTSMSCPNVTGIIALWLQANPELTQNQVKEVIRETSDNDTYTDGDHKVRFGAGKINALEGLKYILQHIPTSIHDVVNGQPKGFDEPGTQKVIRNGKIVIIKNGHEYTPSGQQLM